MSIKVAITMGDAFLLLDVTVPLLLWLLQHARSIAIRRACLLWQDAVLCFVAAPSHLPAQQNITFSPLMALK